MKTSNKQPNIVGSWSIGLLVTAIVLAPGLGNPGFMRGLNAGLAYGQTTTTTTTYSYDNNGNLLSRTTGNNTDTFVYDAENRLISADTRTGTNPAVTTYTYDDDGLRTGTTVGGATTSFLLDKNRAYAQVVLEQTGGTLATYAYGHRLVSQTRTGLGSNFYLADGQLSTRQLVSQTGLVTDRYTYDAFGEILTSNGTTVNNYLFTGEQFDPNVSFYYLRARYYDQATGRFASTDPFNGQASTPLSLHPYLYAETDPVNKRDPSGEFAIIIAAIEILGLISFGIHVNNALKSFAKERTGGLTNRFFYKPCGSSQAGFGAQIGDGWAVIGEQLSPAAGKRPPLGRLYQLYFSGVEIGASLAGEFKGDSVPFSTYKDQKRLLEHFIGEGILTGGLELKAFIVGYTGASQLQLPEQSVVHQFSSFGVKPGLSAQLVSSTAVQFVGLEESPDFFSNNGLACKALQDPKK